MKNILYIAIVSVIALTACKYEEGPGVSLRAKRDRVSNEWIVSNYTFTDSSGTSSDLTANYNPTQQSIYTYFTTSAGLDSTESVEDYSYVYNINRTGAYNLGVVDGDGNSVDPRKMASYVSATGRSNNVNFSMVDPLSIFSVGSRGDWSFINKHSRLQFMADLGGANFSGIDAPSGGKLIPVIFDVVKLANDEMKLTATDDSGAKHEYTFTPISSEKYLNFKTLVDEE